MASPITNSNERELLDRRSVLVMAQVRQPLWHQTQLRDRFRLRFALPTLS